MTYKAIVNVVLRPRVTDGLCHVVCHEEMSSLNDTHYVSGRNHIANMQLRAKW